MSTHNEELHSASSRASVASPPENNNPEGQNSPFPGDNMQNGMPQHAETVINNSKAEYLAVTPPENNNPEGQNSPFPWDNMQSGMPQRTETVTNKSKELMDELQELGKKIKHHEENIDFLKRQNNELDSSILYMEVEIGKHLTTSSSKEEDDSPEKREEETIQRILKCKNSAAALLCNHAKEAQVSPHFLFKDVVGVVALLGKVEDPNLCRFFSVYLGQETMLALVCKTYEGLKSLESYSGDGSVNEGLGIHAFAASVGSPWVGPFNVICIDHIRPYRGELVADDPQRRLNLLEPRLINGEIPPGFLGFAVNMIMINNNNLSFVSTYGHGLRETLFYDLFLNTQVYKTKEDMQKAAPLISNGAISLDGEMMRSPGVFTFGHPRDIDVKFPCEKISIRTLDYLEIEKLLKEAKWKKGFFLEDIKREQQLLDNVMSKFQAKKTEFVQFLANIQSLTTQVAA